MIYTLNVISLNENFSPAAGCLIYCIHHYRLPKTSYRLQCVCQGVYGLLKSLEKISSPWKVLEKKFLILNRKFVIVIFQYLKKFSPAARLNIQQILLILYFFYCVVTGAPLEVLEVAKIYCRHPSRTRWVVTTTCATQWIRLLSLKLRVAGLLVNETYRACMRSEFIDWYNRIGTEQFSFK